MMYDCDHNSIQTCLFQSHRLVGKHQSRQYHYDNICDDMTSHLARKKYNP